MNDNEENDNVQTAGKDEQQSKQNKQQSGGVAKKSAKKVLGLVKKKLLSAGCLIQIIILLILVIALIGAVVFFTSLPGTWIETIKEWKKNIWAEVTGFFTGDNITGKVTEQDQIELAQHIQEMGFDIVGYGFADVKYEYDDEESAEGIDGYANRKIVGFNKSIDGRNYLQAYIAQSEAIYVPSTWSFSGFFSNIFDNITGANENNKNVKAYSKGMLNITADFYKNTLENIVGTITGSSMANIKPQISVNREQKLLRISMPQSVTLRNDYYFNMENWTSRYGKPLELFLALHLSTMMPDLPYDLATENVFNTKVNINLQRVTSTYKVIFDKIGDGTEPISQLEIERVYLKVMCNMTDEEINRFSDAGVLEEAFEKLLNGRSQHADYKFNLTDGAIVDTRGDHGTRLGTNLASVENELLGQKYSTYNITEIGTKTITDEMGNYIEEDYEIEVVQDKILTCKDINIESDRNNAQNELNGTVLSGITVQQLEAFSNLILDGMKKAITYLPRITTIDNHWYYSYVNFVYNKASRAKKKTEYITQNEEDVLSSANLNGGKITLDQTFEDNEGLGGVYYQLCEPEVNGPNDAIVALFKGGSGNINGQDYNFSGRYYRYDGTRATALRIANAKAIEEGKKVGEDEFTFQNELYPVSSLDNTEWEIEKQDVTFAVEDEEGNKSYTDAFTAFSILENIHTEEAEWVYRNLKDLLVKLKYFSKENFTQPLNQVLLWPIESVGSDNIKGEDDSVTKGIEKEENEYGLYLREGQAFYQGETIIAPSDAVVKSVEGNTITLKYKSISDQVAQELEEKFGGEYKSVETDIVLDMEMSISGVNSSVSAGSTVSRGSEIGTAAGGDIRIILYNIDKSIVENLETYMYPTYEKTVEEDFQNERPNSGQPNNNGKPVEPDGGNTENNGENESSGSYLGEDFDADFVFERITSRQNQVYKALRNLGCTKAGACAAMGNLQQESGFDPEAQNSKSTAYGLAQWLYGSGRRQKMEAWCTSHGYATNSFEGQLGFFLEEVQGYKSVWRRMQISSEDSLMEDTKYFSDVYEGYSGELGKRQTYANAFYKQLAD